MTVIRLAGFMGENRAVHPLLLPDTVGTASTNQEPGRGDLRPWSAPGTIDAWSGAGVQVQSARKTIYRMGRSADYAVDKKFWLSWAERVHVVCAPNATDTLERTYFSGGNTPTGQGTSFAPRWTDTAKIAANYVEAGVQNLPSTYSSPLGVPAPTTACVVAAAAASATANVGKYSYTFSETEVAALVVGDVLRISIGLDPLEVTPEIVRTGSLVTGTAYKVSAVATVGTAITSAGGTNTLNAVFTATGPGLVDATGLVTPQTVVLANGAAIAGTPMTLASLAAQLHALSGISATVDAAQNAVEAADGVTAVEAVEAGVTVLSDTVGATFIIEKRTAINALENWDSAAVTYVAKYGPSVAATALVNGTTYRIESVGTTNFMATPPDAGANTVGTVFTATGAGIGSGKAYTLAIGSVKGTITAGSFITGVTYIIKTVGSTVFTSIGADTNEIGQVFVATGAGSGTGTAEKGMASIAIPAADIAGLTVGHYWVVSVNSGADVRVQLQAGTGTFPSAVTATSLAESLNAVPGINAVATLAGGVLLYTETFGTILNASGCNVLIRTVTPGASDSYERLVTAAEIVEPESLIESRYYTYTYVTKYGEESAPAPPSLKIDCAVGATINISSLPSAAPTGYSDINRIRVYRTQPSSSGADFYFLREPGDIVAATALQSGTTYTIVVVGDTNFVNEGVAAGFTVGTEFTATRSNTAGAGTGKARRHHFVTSTTDDARPLGEVLGTTTWTMPPSDLSWLTGLWNGMMAGISGGVAGSSGGAVRFCEPYTYYAWPVAYEIVPSNAQPVALATFGQTLVMLTNGNPSIIMGVTPDSMDESPLEFYQACVSPLSAVGVGHGVVWASPDGLCFVGQGGAKVLTEGVMTREQWQALVPSTIIGCFYERRYFGFYKDGFNNSGGVDATARKAFMFDFNNPNGLYFMDFGVDALYVDDLNDTFYVLDGVNIQKWDAGSAKTVTFKSKLYRMPKPMPAFSCAQVVADSYPVTFKLYVDGNATAKHTQTVASSEAFRLPAGYHFNDCQVEVSGVYGIQGVAVAHSMTELAQV